MTALVVPGVRVEARFDVLPPLPAPSGILGAVGIVDRPPGDGALTGVTKVPELRDLLGPGTEVSMPQVMHALSNGASEAVVAAVAGGGPAAASLPNADGQRVVRLRCRSNGAWANDDRLQVEVRGTANAEGDIVRVNLVLLRDGQVAEQWPDLRVDPGASDDLFETINRRSRLVVAVDPGFADATPAEVDTTFDPDADDVSIPVEEEGGDRVLFRFLPAPESEPDGLRVRLEVADDGAMTVEVFQGGFRERFRDLTMDPDSDRHLPAVLLTESRLVRARQESSFPEEERLPAPTGSPISFADGTSPTVAQYRDAIDRLADDPRIDLVLAAVEPHRSDDDARQIHQALLAHAVAMAEDAAPRIAFGSVTPNEQGSVDGIRDHAASVRHRRFVLVSPAGAEGAVAGMVGRMNPRESPTFKTVPLFGIAPATYRESELNRLLGPRINLLVVQQRTGRGVVVLKGIDTTGDQISVTRVADRAIRMTKATAENFIGRLNTDEARLALRQQLTAAFTRMEREHAIVPSTDGSDPAFLVDVYSTQQDFARGIVRVDIALRPVRSIDYVYATIRVKH